MAQEVVADNTINIIKVTTQLNFKQIFART